MPRISAPTVAEHRAAQLAALLKAAREVIHDKGIGAVTPRAVGERAGLARTSVYEYFASRDDILVAVAIDEIEKWDAEINSALEGLTGAERLSRFVKETMQMAARGHHDLANQLAQAPLSPTNHDELRRLHDDLIRTTALVLSDLGITDPAITTRLVQGLLNTGVQLVGHGAEPEAVAKCIVDMIAGILGR